MGIFTGMNVSASALTAQRLRMDVISSNIANAQTTRASFEDGEWQPYRRKMVAMEPMKMNFNDHLNNELETGGVKVTEIVEDESPFKMVYRPNHPDANENGYVQLPNVDLLKEMVDLVGSTRSYQANMTALNANKNMLLQALKIGR